MIELSHQQKVTLLVALRFTQLNLDDDLQESFPWLTEKDIETIYNIIESTMPVTREEGAVDAHLPPQTQP